MPRASQINSSDIGTAARRLAWEAGRMPLGTTCAVLAGKNQPECAACAPTLPCFLCARKRNASASTSDCIICADTKQACPVR